MTSRWQVEGATLVGEELGRGDPPIVFVHGWCCDRSFLAPQLEYFARRHRVLSVDLRGHGQSEGASDSCDLGHFAADLLALIDRLGLEGPIVVGHSMGGMLALELALQRPDGLRGIAMLDSIVAAPPELRAAAQGLSLLLDSPRCSETIAEFVERYLLRPDTDARLRARAVETMSGADPRVAIAAWRSMVDYDDRGALKACTVPILFTAVETTIAGIDEFPQLNERIEVVRIPGVSHFHPVEAPGATNAHLERFIATCVRPRLTHSDASTLSNP